MNLSYWEHKSWFTDIDYTIIGSGIVGLNCALQLKTKHPNARILIIERGFLPQGASTKNAGFACFGSLSEILSDLENHSEASVFELIQKRIQGLQLLRTQLSDAVIDYRPYGGYELFERHDTLLLESCLEAREKINTWLFPLFKANVFKIHKNTFGFKSINNELIFNAFEGQIDTGKMMDALVQKVLQSGVRILNGITVTDFVQLNNKVQITTDKVQFNSRQLCIATNGFASELLNESVKPARAQVLITKPIKDLKIKGTFHLDQGYYYFRNIDDRILFGGGRNMDFKTEETTVMEQTEMIQNRLEELLQTTILPDTTFEIDQRWSGIMGVGPHKDSIVKAVSSNVFCGVRLGGMGIAIGSLIGKELAQITNDNG